VSAAQYRSVVDDDHGAGSTDLHSPLVYDEILPGRSPSCEHLVHICITEIELDVLNDLLAPRIFYLRQLSLGAYRLVVKCLISALKIPRGHPCIVDAD
jgi:hypothetical protein